MIKELNTVLEYLQGKIADELDVNRRHIEIINIETPFKKRVGKDYETTRTVKFKNNNEPEKERTAVWTEFKYFNGEMYERLQITD